MTKNNLCCRIFPIVLIVISALISTAIWYFEEGIHSFRFLTDWTELINFIGTVLFVALLPIGIFYYLNDKDKYQDKARQISFLGFVPALALLVFIIA